MNFGFRILDFGSPLPLPLRAPADATTGLGSTLPPSRLSPLPPPSKIQNPKSTTGKGFFTDTSLCIGCKACEVACKQWNGLPSDGYEWSGFSYDNTRALSGTTWRHVAFIEKPGVGTPGVQTNWLMSSDVCKHCTHAGCLQACPTGAIVRTEFNTVVIQDDICNGCGYCVPSCPFGVVDMAEVPPTGVPGAGWQLTADGLVRQGHLPQLATINSSEGMLAHKCTLCYDRLVDGMEPACAKACPTDSIQFGDLDDLRARATRRVADLHARGATEAYLYGAHEGDPGTTGDIGPLGAFFLLLDRPETYNLPAKPFLPQSNVLMGYVTTGLTALALGLGAIMAFRSTKSNK